MDDRQQIEAILDAFYRTISGAADDTRDWESLRELFSERARVSPLPWGPEAVSQPFAEYIERLKTALDGRTFYERGLDYRIEITGSLAQVWSRYEAASTPDWAERLKAGTNLVQLLKQRGAWKILSMLYEDDAG